MNEGFPPQTSGPVRWGLFSVRYPRDEVLLAPIGYHVHLLGVSKLYWPMAGSRVAD
jgi:hypothetical protein